MVDDYTSGTFSVLLANPLGGDTGEVSLIETATTVGDTTLAYTGQGTVQTFSEDLSTGTGTFGSGEADDRNAKGGPGPEDGEPSRHTVSTLRRLVVPVT